MATPPIPQLTSELLGLLEAAPPANFDDDAMVSLDLGTLRRLIGHLQRGHTLSVEVRRIATVLDFEANLGDPRRTQTLREIVKQLTAALEGRCAS